MKRVVVTGLGAVSALGEGLEANFAAALAGHSGVTALDRPFAARLETKVAAQIPGDPDAGLARSELGMFDRCSRLAWLAAHEALNQSGFAVTPANARNGGLFWGTGMGGATSLEQSYVELLQNNKERLRPFTVVLAMNNGPAALVALKSGFKGPLMTYSSACASSAQAIGEAFRHIRHGLCDYALAGGSEALLTLGVIKAWDALRTLAATDTAAPAASCKPFSARRSGFVLGEAGAALMLESLDSAQARGATILGEVAGFGNTSDSYHLTKPDPEGQTAAMRAALAEAGIAPEAVGYVNAHGTATDVGDIAETESIKAAFGDHARKLLISSTKAVHGHTLGAAGALEAALTVQALEQGAIPPTAHLTDPDPRCDLDYVPLTARQAAVEYALSNSFAFGGANSVLAFRAWRRS
jgi:3-oxoacyl-[acyl-carrier-protein] synthase II